MAKYSFEFKQKIVQDYLSGKGGYRYLAEQNNIPDRKIIRNWIYAYRLLGDDGLFRRNDSQSEQASANVRVASGALESSNVNVVDEMTNLIRLQRQYETQVKMMQTADKNDEAQNQLLRLV